MWEKLGIEPTMDLKEVKKAYARLSKQYHPEENPKEFQEIQEAYQQIKIYIVQNRNKEDRFGDKHQENSIQIDENKRQEERIDFSSPLNYQENPVQIDENKRQEERIDFSSALNYQENSVWIDENNRKQHKEPLYGQGQIRDDKFRHILEYNIYMEQMVKENDSPQFWEERFLHHPEDIEWVYRYWILHQTLFSYEMSQFLSKKYLEVHPYMSQEIQTMVTQNMNLQINMDRGQKRYDTLSRYLAIIGSILWACLLIWQSYLLFGKSEVVIGHLNGWEWKSFYILLRLSMLMSRYYLKTDKIEKQGVYGHLACWGILLMDILVIFSFVLNFSSLITLIISTLLVEIGCYWILLKKSAVIEPNWNRRIFSLLLVVLNMIVVIYFMVSHQLEDIIIGAFFNQIILVIFLIKAFWNKELRWIWILLDVILWGFIVKTMVLYDGQLSSSMSSDLLENIYGEQAVLMFLYLVVAFIGLIIRGILKLRRK